MKRLVFSLFLGFQLFYYQVEAIAEEYPFLDIEILPDLKAPNKSPEMRNIRVQELIVKLPELKHFGGIYFEDLNEEDFQVALVTQNPALLKKLPIQVTLKSKAIALMAQRIYKFNYFLPDYIKQQKLVKDVTLKSSKSFTQNFKQYSEEMTEEIKNSKGIFLIHPDFFSHPIFVETFQQTCAPPTRHNKFSESDFRHIRLYSAAGYETPTEQWKISFQFLRKLGNFNQKQRELFLQKHPPYPLAIECYPEDFLHDENFVRELVRRFPFSHFLDISYEKTKKETLKNDYIKNQLRRLNRIGFSPEDLKNIVPEIWKEHPMQTWIYENIQVLKIENSTIQLEETYIENFIKQHYVPERFFSENQKTNPIVARLLSKYPNKSLEFLPFSKEFSIAQLKKVSCCGTSALSFLGSLTNDIPDKFLEDPKFIMDLFTKVRQEDVVKIVLKRVQLPNEAKDFLIKNCFNFNLKGWAIRNFENSIQEDKSFLEKLKTDCK